MDLERCAKCGNRWIAGHEKCMECGFVPIGAGLKSAPKKKRRYGRYVEPGSSRGFLSLILLGLVGFGCYRYQPWNDDWEMVRAMLGQGRHHSLVGEWEVVRTFKINKDKPPVLTQAGMKSGTLNFSKKGTVKLVFNPQGEKAVANGRYVVDGSLVAVNSVKSDSGVAALPPAMKMKLAWSGPNQLIASVGSEALYMRRLGDGNPLLRMMKGGAESNGGALTAAVKSGLGESGN